MLDSLAVILLEPRNPLNIGAAARAMSNFGCFDLRLVKPYDLAYHEAVSAVNAGHVLARSRVFDTLADALADRHFAIGTASPGHRDLKLPLERLEAGGLLLRQHLAASEACALLFGSEKFGLSNDDLSLCDALLTIPTRQAHESMNLGQAVAVCLYELVRLNDVIPYQRAARATATIDQLTRTEDGLMEALHLSGYLNPLTADTSRLKLRRLLRRLTLSSRDSTVWQGMLRQILWKLRKPSHD